MSCTSSETPTRTTPPLLRRGAAGAVVLGALLLSACGSTPEDETQDQEIYVRTLPIEEISLVSDVSSPVSLGSDPGSVHFSWQGLMGGQPVDHDECVGMVSLSDPQGHLITFDPSLRSCEGSTELDLDLARQMSLNAEGGSPLGDYHLKLMLNGMSMDLIFQVQP